VGVVNYETILIHKGRAFLEISCAERWYNKEGRNKAPLKYNGARPNIHLRKSWGFPMHRMHLCNKYLTQLLLPWYLVIQTSSQVHYSSIKHFMH